MAASFTPAGEKQLLLQGGGLEPKLLDASLNQIWQTSMVEPVNGMNEFLNRHVNTVITVCGNADQACPIFPGQVNRYHWGFEDPAHATGSEEEVLAVFRRVRDQIKVVFEAYAAGYREAAHAR